MITIQATSKTGLAVGFVVSALPKKPIDNIPALSCLHVEERDGFVYIVGTDANMMNIAKIPTDKCEIPLSPNEHWNFEVKKNKQEFYLEEASEDIIFPNWEKVIPEDREFNCELDGLEFYDSKKYKTYSLSKSIYKISSVGACFDVDFLKKLGIIDNTWIGKISYSRRCGFFYTVDNGIAYKSLIMGVVCDGAWQTDGGSK